MCSLIGEYFSPEKALNRKKYGYNVKLTPSKGNVRDESVELATNKMNRFCPYIFVLYREIHFSLYSLDKWMENFVQM